MAKRYSKSGANPQNLWLKTPGFVELRRGKPGFMGLRRGKPGFAYSFAEVKSQSGFAFSYAGTGSIGVVVTGFARYRAGVLPLLFRYRYRT